MNCIVELWKTDYNPDFYLYPLSPAEMKLSDTDQHSRQYLDLSILNLYDHTKIGSDSSTQLEEKTEKKGI